MADTIEKIRKLLALSHSSNESEAAAALAQALRIAAREDIDIEQLKGTEFEDPVTEKSHREKSRFQPWEYQIYIGLAHIFACRIIQKNSAHRISTGRWQTRETVQIIGRKSDIEIVSFLTEYLYRELLNLWKQNKQRVLLVSRFSKEKIKSDYLYGAALKVMEKANVLYKQDIPEAEQEQTAALIHKRSAAVEVYVKQNYPHLAEGNSRYKPGNACLNGYSDADDIRINKAVQAATPSTLQIGA